MCPLREPVGGGGTLLSSVFEDPDPYRWVPRDPPPPSTSSVPFPRPHVRPTWVVPTTTHPTASASSPSHGSEGRDFATLEHSERRRSHRSNASRCTPLPVMPQYRVEHGPDLPGLWESDSLSGSGGSGSVSPSSPKGRRGRAGLRTSEMREVARARMIILFTFAQSAVEEGDLQHANRYVQLACRVGTRYNVRIPPSFRDRFCRRCLGYFHEGATVRTRIRSGRRIRTCLSCGAIRRRPIPKAVSSGTEGGSAGLQGSPEIVAVEDAELPEEEAEDEG